MALRTVLLLAALATATSSCVVAVTEPGAVAADGTVYLGWNLFSSKGKTDREDYPVGQGLGSFSSIRLHTDKAINFNKVVVIFADGERWAAPVPAKLAAGQWTAPIALRAGPRPIHSIVVTAQSPGKHLAKVEIHGTH